MLLRLSTLILLFGLNTGWADPTRDAWESLLTKRLSKRPAFDFVEANPDLLNVPIYGDSISVGYTPRVSEQLAGKANVFRLHTNGGESSSFIPKMEKLHKTMGPFWKFQWDVIHFNVGLRDLKYLNDLALDAENGKQVSSTKEYRENLDAIIAYLKQLAPHAALIFATTTPVPEGQSGMIAGDAAHYNETALQFMREHPEIIINDLYTLTLPHQSDWWILPGNAHFNEVGQHAQDDQVTGAILTAIE